MKVTRFTVLAVLVGLIAVTTTAVVNASAGMIYEWEHDYGDFNRIVETSTKAVFESPGMDSFLDPSDWSSVANWTGSYVSANEISASGPARDTLVWAVHFSDTFQFTPFSYEFYAYLDDKLIDWTTVLYNGGGDLSNGDNFSYEAHNVNPVPEPATLLFLLSGLAGVAPLRKRMNRVRTTLRASVSI